MKAIDVLNSDANRTEKPGILTVRNRAIIDIFTALMAMLYPFVARSIILCMLILGGCSLYHPNDVSNHQCTVHGLGQLQLLLSNYVKERKAFPPATPEGLHAALWKQDCEWDNLKKILSGMDFWDRALIIQQPVKSMLLVRSVGANGIDEDGSGDDIEVCVVLSGEDVWQRLWVGHLGEAR